jgi:hypothetical protein
MRITYILTAGAVLAATGGRATAEIANFDRNGRLTSMVYGGEELAARGRVSFPRPTGAGSPSRRRLRVAEAGSRTRVRSPWKPAGPRAFAKP